MKYLKFLSIIILVVVFGNKLMAQNKWSAEFRPNISFPTEDLGESNIETGFGFELTVYKNCMSAHS